MSDDLVKQLRNDSGREVCKRDMPDFPCAALCPCALDLRILADADELDRLRAENARLREALEKADVTIKTADALAEAVGLVISTTDPRVYLQAFDGVRVSHDAYRKSRAAPQTKGDER